MANPGDLGLAATVSLELAAGVGAGLVPLKLDGMSPPVAAWLWGRAMDQLGRLLWLQLMAVLVPVEGVLSEPPETRLLLATSLAWASVRVKAGPPPVLVLLLMYEDAVGDVRPLGEGNPRAALHSSTRPVVLSS